VFLTKISAVKTCVPLMEQCMIQTTKWLRRLFCVLLSCIAWTAVAQAQNWSSILSSSRATNWDKAGLPAALPDGETTPNAWTPPTRTQCGSTVAAGTSFATINSDMASCGSGHYVSLGTGTFTSSSTGLVLGNQNGVTLRGQGADKTILKCSSGCSISWQNTTGGNSANSNWTAGYAQGTTTITLASVSGIVPGATTITLAGTGGGTDPGGVWICAQAGVCSSVSDVQQQYENQLVTNVAGNGPFTVTISPGLGFPAWSTLTSRYAVWYSPEAYGVGLEDLTVDCTGNSGGCTSLSYSYASWIKGVRIINGSNTQLGTQSSAFYLIANSYLVQTVSENAELLNINTDGWGLILNNIFQSAGSFIHGPGADDVYAYNLGRDAYNNGGSYFVNNTISDHIAGYSVNLVEGNEIGDWQEDNVHGSANLNTFFRNTFYGNDPPFHQTNNEFGIYLGGVARFENVIGNVMGNPDMSSYKCTPSSCSGTPVIILGAGGTGITDTLSVATAMFWGNYDIVTNAVRWCGNSSNTGWSTTCASASEVPTSLSGNAAPYDNAVPSSQVLPASFFLSAMPSWWKVCTNYPTCSTFQTQPFPPIGPDVTGGDINGTGGFPNYHGFAYHIPAYVAWKNLPIDTTYQNTYSITGSSWSGGTETLTVSGLPGVFISGEFQISGGNCTGTYMITGSTSSTVSYALASNPGSCTSGSFLFPDVRAFNDAVYGLNSGSAGLPAAPTNLSAVVQ
jgi:hypothetical protein